MNILFTGILLDDSSRNRLQHDFQYGVGPAGIVWHCNHAVLERRPGGLPAGLGEKVCLKQVKWYRDDGAAVLRTDRGDILLWVRQGVPVKEAYAVADSESRLVDELRPTAEDLHGTIGAYVLQDDAYEPEWIFEPPLQKDEQWLKSRGFNHGQFTWERSFRISRDWYYRVVLSRAEDGWKCVLMFFRDDTYHGYTVHAHYGKTPEEVLDNCLAVARNELLGGLERIRKEVLA